MTEHLYLPFPCHINKKKCIINLHCRSHPLSDPMAIASPAFVNCPRVNLRYRRFSTRPIHHMSHVQWYCAGLYEYHHPPVSSVGNTTHHQNCYLRVLSPALFVRPIAVRSAWPRSDGPRLSVHVSLNIHYKSISVVHLLHPMACDCLPPHLPDSPCHAVSAVDLCNSTIRLVPPFTLSTYHDFHTLLTVLCSWKTTSTNF